MDVSGAGKSPNTSLSFRYNANNEEIEELYQVCDDDPPTPHCDAFPTIQSENASPKKSDKTSSIIDKYFKSMRVDKINEKLDEIKSDVVKVNEEKCSTPPKEVTSSPMKDYLNRLGKKSTSEASDVKESNETWKIFHDFKSKIAQAVDDMKSRSVEDTKEKSVPRENSISDSEESSAIKDCDQQSVGDTDNQVSSLDSSIQNLSEISQAVTAKANNRDTSLPLERSHSESTDDTHKNFESNNPPDVSKDFLLDDNSLMDVESGVEALEESNIEAYGDGTYTDGVEKEKMSEAIRSKDCPTPTKHFPYKIPEMKKPDLKSEAEKPKIYFFNFPMYFLTILLLLSYFLFPNSNLLNGFLLGLWSFYFLSELKQWVFDTYLRDWEADRGSFFQLKKTSAVPLVFTIPPVKEHKPLKKYEGWINHYRCPDYDPYTYHINKTATAFMKLEGCNLRISYTKTKIAKRALWDEKIENVTFYQHRLYNLTGARVILLPKGLVTKRHWSKKYPICVILNENEKIQILEKENAAAEKRAEESPARKSKDLEVESAETNTSPEKKKKFVWRRREKSISHTDAEPGREGLRHRLVRKMHRDKKTDSVSTYTEPASDSQSADKSDKIIQFEDATYHDAEGELSTRSTTSTKDDVAEEDLDDTELSRIKDFLEEAESEGCPDGNAEGEWSVHVKHSKDKHSHLYLFTRTGRDKHEWYRRLITAVQEANVSADSSAADDKCVSEPTDKDAVEQAVYKVGDKESVVLSKPASKSQEFVSEPVSSPTSVKPPTPCPMDFESLERTFWPFLFKIIQAKSPSNDCECRMLPAEVTWVNTALARVIYDVMRDPVTIGKVQHRIQRKLNTLKLPSFMSPLVVTALSLEGACPLVERVTGPSWDERGVWMDAALRYDGGAYISILTQINLLKLKERNITLEDQLLGTHENVIENEIGHTDLEYIIFSEKQLRQRKPAIFDSEVEDSAESSSDDENTPVQPFDSDNDQVSVRPSVDAQSDGGSSKKKFLRMVDKIATNKYFQQVTDYKYVKRAMEGLSNTDIKLQLEIHGLEGQLAVNLPPPPHDRVWIGFRTNPQLVLKARPAFGARTLRFAHISKWIEQKLSKEFEKVLVLPNMEDIIVDLMTPTPVDFD